MKSSELPSRPPPWVLPKSFYERAIKLSHKKNKKIGIAVCDTKTYKPLSNLNFDFYKLLSIAINEEDLIKDLKKKKKQVFISTGSKVTDKEKTGWLSKEIEIHGGKNNLMLAIQTLLQKNQKAFLRSWNYNQ